MNLNKDILIICFFNNYNYQYNIINQIQIQECEQWNQIQFSFIASNILLQIHLNSQLYQEIINLDQYQITHSQLKLLENKFLTSLEYSNSIAIYDKLLVVQKVTKETDQFFDFCDPMCDECLGFKCLHHCQNEEYFNKNDQQCQNLTNSILYEFIKQNEQEKESKCLNCQINYDFVQCQIFQHEYGDYYSGCQFQQLLFLDLVNQLDIQQYIPNLNRFQMVKYMPTKHITYYYERFAVKMQDIYVTYYDYHSKIIYCELGYHLNLSCKKNNKQCWFQKKECILCQQRYSYFKNKCTKCQKNCLACTIIKKKIICILFINNYFIDQRGLLKKCDLQQNVTICQHQDVIIQNLINSGNNICQHKIYSIENNLCMNFDIYDTIYDVIEYPNYISIAKQKLEIQDMILVQNMQEFQNKEIIMLINLQQTLKLIKSLEQNKISISNQNRDIQTQFLNQIGFQEQDLIQQKITLDVQAFMGSHILYQNHTFEEPIHLYQQLQLYNFKQIQYNMLILQKFPEFGEKLERSQNQNTYEYLIDYLNYQNVSFIFNITFQSSHRIIFLDCNSFYFKAHKVIINNMTFINHSKYDFLCNEYGRISISSQYITIRNINIQRLQCDQMFYFQDFINLQIYNLKVYESILQQFITAQTVQKYNLQSIEIQNVSIINSQTFKFIQCSPVQNADIRNILIYQSIIWDLFIQLKGEFQNININNIQFFGSSIIQSVLFHIESPQVRDVEFINNVTIQNIFISENYLNISVIFGFYQIRYLNLIHICISNTKFYQGFLLQFDKYDLNIDSIHIDNVVMIRSTLIMFQGIAIQIFQAFIHIDFSESSLIFYLNNGDVQLQQIYFKIHRFNSSQIINIKSYEIILNQIIIINQSLLSVIENCFKLFEVQSITNSGIYIRDIRFINFRIIDSVILILSTNYKLILEKLYIINIDLIIRNVKQLIQINLGQKILDQIQIYNTSVSTQVNGYAFISFGNEIEMIHISYMNVINLNNQQPQIHIILIKNELAFLGINRMFAKNLSSIQLMLSESCYFNIINGRIFNILSHSNYYPFIICSETNDIIKSNRVFIQNIQIYRFGYCFIRLDSITNIITEINNINFQECNISGGLFMVEQKQYKQDYYNYIIINNISIINTYQIESMHQQYIFYVNAYFVKINQIYIHNINSQFLLLQNFGPFQIKNVYIANILSNKFIELRSNISLIVIIFNFFIQNSTTFMDSLFKLMLRQQITMIRQIRILNIKIKSEIFYLNIQKQKQITLSDLIIKNVISHNRLFYSTSNINYHSVQIINTYQLIIFQNQGTTLLKNGLITNIFQESTLSESRRMIINDSEIVNSNIIQDVNKLEMNQSLFEGNLNHSDQITKIHISLNQGASMFKYKMLEENLFQVIFDDNNNYLYLPSGRDVQSYRYFCYKTQQYKSIYHSLSFVNIYQAQQIECIFSQSIDNTNILQKQINVKPGVNVANNLIFTLNPIYKDKHIQMDLICSQNGQLITYRTLIKTFNCQLGEYLYKDQCLECNIELQLYSVGYNQQNCIYMDQNKIKELKLGQIKLYQQYWRYSYANKYIEQCINQNCQGGWQTGDQSCQIGYIGAICQECDINNIRGDGYYGKIDSYCYLCYFDQKIYLKGLLLIIYQLLLVYLSYYSNRQQSQQYLFLRISQRKFTEIILRQNVDQVTILLKLYYNYLFTIFILKDLINFGDSISFSLNLLYNPNIALPQFDCLINSAILIPIQYTQLLYKIVIPLFLFNISIIIYFTLIKFKYIKYSIYIIIVILYTVYQQNQIIIIQSLIKLSAKVKYSNIFWTLENLAVQYFSRIHQYYMYVLIVPLIIVFTLTFIIIFYWIRIINQRIFNNLKLSLFIYKQYKHQFTYWEQIRLSYIYIFMFAYYVLDNYYIIFLVLIVITIIIQLKPFQLKNLNHIDLLIYVYSAYSYLAIFIIQKDRQQFSSVIIIISNLILLKTYLNQFNHGLHIQYKQTKINFLNLFIKYIPYQKYIIQLDKYEKNKYYYQLLRENRKKSNNSVTRLFQSAISRQNQYASFEVELSAINQISIK